MLVAEKDVADIQATKIFRNFSDMPRKKPVTDGMGRPRAIYVTPEQMTAMAAALKQSAEFLMDSAKFMRENNVDRVMLSAAKVFDEHLPAVQTFCRRAFAEVGPAATALALGRKTKTEHNQERHTKRKT